MRIGRREAPVSSTNVTLMLSQVITSLAVTKAKTGLPYHPLASAVSNFVTSNEITSNRYLFK